MNRKFRKLTSNRRIKDPLQREINELCRYFDRQVNRTLTSGNLKVYIGSVKYQTPHLGGIDLFSSESKECYNNGDTVMKQLVDNFIKLNRRALKKYNVIISDSNYTYTLSDIQNQLYSYKVMDRDGDVVAFRFECNFWCNIEFKSSTTNDVLENMDNTWIN